MGRLEHVGVECHMAIVYTIMAVPYVQTAYVASILALRDREYNSILHTRTILLPHVHQYLTHKARHRLTHPHHRQWV
jgi:hypothetical protein